MQLRIDGPSMLAAAAGRRANLRWRAAIGLVFAVAAGLTLNAPLLALGWFVVLCAAKLTDHWLGGRFVGARDAQARRTYGWLFVSASTFSVVIFAAMGVMAALLGGAQGAALCIALAASSLVCAMISLFAAPGYMAAMAIPSVLCLGFTPFASFGASPASPAAAGLGVALGVGAFIAYLVRSALQSARALADLEAANRVTRERQAEAEARQIEAEEANRAKGEFLTTMTHELRTPLNAVIGYSEIIHEDLELDGRQDLAGDAKRITGAARHLLGLIDQVLQLTRMDSGRGHVTLSEVDVGRVVQECATGVDHLIQANGNRMAVRIAPELGAARTDEEKLTLCVEHLVSNAAKFTSGGLVAVNVDSERADGKDWLRIAVSDTGQGMSQQQIEKAFQPFTQVDGSKTRAQGGMGLGLTIAARTAKLLRGQITAVSEPGAGSTFTLRVPLRLGDEIFQREGEQQAAPALGAAA